LFPEIAFDCVRPGPGAHERSSGPGPALQLLFVPRAPGSTGKGAITQAWSDEHLPQLVAYEVVQLLQSGMTIDGAPILPRHVAVLCRTNAQARDTQAALRDLRVPTVLDGDSSVLETPMAQELSDVLWAVARPADTRRHAAALVSSILGVSGEGLYRMRADEAGLEPWLERFARLNQLWHERGFIQMLHRLLDEAGTQQKLLSRVDGERRLTDLLHLSELLHQACVQQHLGPLSLLAWFSRVRNDPQARTEMAAESSQVRLEHDEHALKLTTVHRSKGLEYPIVFCPFMASGRAFNEKDVRFHDREDQDRVKLDLGSPEHARHAGLAAHEELAENLRLLYVALTRAKHRCYLVFGRFRKSGLSPVAYLLQKGGDTKPLEADALEARIEALDDAQLRAEVGALCEASEGAIGVRDIRVTAPETHQGAAPAAAGELRARNSARALQASPRVSSFSRLTADQAAAPSAAAEQGLDLDEATQAAPELVLDQPDAPAQALITLHDFPQGARPGILIHSIYEHIDFGRNDPSELRARVQSALRLGGLDRGRHAETLVLGIDQSLRAPLDDDDPPLTLASIAREKRLDELEFTLSTPRAGAMLSASRLASVLEGFGAPACAPDYPERLRTLRMLPPTGFLKGFIDLVFRANERFYIVDYKSNWLGRSATDYQRAQLVSAMREHHYFLQYHLYSVALHRQLAVRLPGYDYARHFGGVYYLFMRGMSPDHPRGTGVFFDRPELGLIEALAQAIGASEVSA
jgi:exodeoxyribonuclease V beta subunit